MIVLMTQGRLDQIIREFFDEREPFLPYAKRKDLMETDRIIEESERSANAKRPPVANEETTRRITWKIARWYVEMLGGKLRHTIDSEYVLSLGGAEGTRYYSDSARDMIETARALMGSHRNHEKAEQFLKDMGVSI